MLGSLTVRYYIRCLGMSGLREARYSGLFGLLVGTVPRLSLTLHQDVELRVGLFYQAP